MTQPIKNQSILVVSQGLELAAVVRNAVAADVETDYASSPSEGLEKVRASRPDIVVLGPLEPPGAVWKFYGELRQGWISRHSSVLVVELDYSEGAHRVLDDDYLQATGAHTANGGLLVPRESLLPALKQKIAVKLQERQNRLKASLLGPDKFCLIWEQIPGLGAFEMRQELVIQNARKAAQGGKICSISVTDNPGGNPAISTEILAQEIRKLGIEPLVHVAFRDKSRNQCESLLYQLAAMNINNLLVLTGDYPSNVAFQGTSRPVFDLDAVNGLQLIAEMNRGMEHEIMRKMTTLAPTDFFCGVAFSPFKQEEAEVMGQYYKLMKKIRAGADFLITQVGYDVRKWHELKLWLKAYDYRIPAVASIYALSEATARAMNANQIPGCVVTDKLVAQVAAEAATPDKGRQARLDRAARLYAIARGLGFSGASISGLGLPYESVQYIVARGEELAGNWQGLVREFDYPQENGFYYFQRDPETGLNLAIPAPRTQPPAHPPIYYFSRAVHAAVFEPRSPLFKVLRPLARFVASSRTLRKVFGSFEFWTKAVLYSCMNCGDCALFDVAYLCPVSQCPKNQRNGPCGGSHHGWCEIYENEKKCIWVRAYRRLKTRRRQDSIGGYIVPPCDWGLWQTSSWLNFYLGRDHVSRRLGIKPETQP